MSLKRSARTIKPSFATPDRPSKLDPFAEKLAGWLRTKAGKSRKQRRTLKQMHADLVKLGFTGSYNRVAAFAGDWRTNRQRKQQTTGRGTFVPLPFRPGEAFQFDWSEDYGHLTDERTKLQMAHIKLSHSRTFLLRAYPLQTHKMVFDAHWHAFRVFGGVSERGIYDNMKTAMDRVGRGKERQVNLRFLTMANHYVFEPEFCNPAAGWEKGQVEKNVQDSRHQVLYGMPGFPDLATMNAWLEQRCLKVWQETPHGTLPGTIADVWAEERAALMPLLPAFDGFIELSKRVSPTCLISFERNRDTRADVIREPACQPADLSRPARRGGIILLFFSTSPGLSGTERHLRNCRLPSGSCRSRCCANPGVIARWPTSSPWFSSMTSRRF